MEYVARAAFLHEAVFTPWSRLGFPLIRRGGDVPGIAIELDGKKLTVQPDGCGCAGQDGRFLEIDLRLKGTRPSSKKWRRTRRRNRACCSLTRRRKGYAD